MIAEPAPTASCPPAEETGAAALSRREAQHDAGLVRRFKAGDLAAFDEIALRHRERLSAVAYGLLRNHADAEEIAQDALVRAHRGLVNFRGDSSLATWLHRIALNLARNRYWYFFRRRRHATVSLNSSVGVDNPTAFSELFASGEAGPVHAAQAEEFSELVARAMKNLSAAQRKILTMRNAQHHSYRQIADHLGINVGTVKSRIARAREGLRLLLATACPEFGPEARPVAWFDRSRPAGGIEVLCA